MKHRGFTLIELLAVVLIMGVLTAIAVPQYKKSMERSRVAEALQMLPAIYESRERLILEQDEPYDKGDIIFSRLDTEMKGRAATSSDVPSGANSGHYWLSENFKYNLFDDTNGLNGTGEYEVSAMMRKGAYTSVMLYFNGDEVRCCHSTNANTDACDALNVPQLSTGC